MKKKYKNYLLIMDSDSLVIKRSISSNSDEMAIDMASSLCRISELDSMKIYREDGSLVIHLTFQKTMDNEL